MSPTRLFGVYKEVVYRREFACYRQGTSSNSAIAYYKREWERLDRIAKKLEVRLMGVFAEYEAVEQSVQGWTGAELKGEQQ